MLHHFTVIWAGAFCVASILGADYCKWNGDPLDKNVPDLQDNWARFIIIYYPGCVGKGQNFMAQETLWVL